MTIIEVMENLGLSGMLRMMIRGVLSARCPGLIEKQLNIIIDKDSEVVTLQAGGEPVVVLTFGEIEGLVNGHNEGKAIPKPDGAKEGPADVPGQGLN